MHNNLLLHRNHDPLNELKPHAQSPQLMALQRQIMAKSTRKSEERVGEKVKWLEEAMSREPGEGKFRCTYVTERRPEVSVRQQLSKIYNVPRRSGARGSFSQSLYGLN